MREIPVAIALGPMFCDMAQEVQEFHNLKPAENLSDVASCPHGCSGDLCYPIDWHMAIHHNVSKRYKREDIWLVEIRCPECDHRYTNMMEENLIELFDHVLDMGTAQIVKDLRKLSFVNMSNDIDRFMEALEGDHILPEDFVN